MMRARERPILVPVANPASAAPLLRYAAALAGPDGFVHLLTVVDPQAPDHDRGAAGRGLRQAESLADELGVSVRGEVREAPSAALGVLDAIDDVAPALVLMGWRGVTTFTDVFGRLIDHVIGRSSVPLAVIRLGRAPIERIVVPVSSEHLLPGGDGSLSLAAEFTTRLRSSFHCPTTVLRTGARNQELPRPIRELGDRVHHDPRRTHQAVEAFSHPTDLIIAAVAPTASGLRAATTHLAWAAPDATLLVAVDVGPMPEGDLLATLTDAGGPAPDRPREPMQQQQVVVTVRLPDDHTTAVSSVESILHRVGDVDLVMSWWPDDDDRPHVGATVTVQSEGPNRALAIVMTALHEAPEMVGAEISYELDRNPARPRVRTPSTSAARGGSSARRLDPTLDTLTGR